MFNTMPLLDALPKGRDLRSKGSLVMKLSNDAGALIILMYIVHGMVRKVPRNISLFTLAKPAEWVHYFQLHVAVEIFSDYLNG